MAAFGDRYERSPVFDAMAVLEVVRTALVSADLVFDEGAASVRARR
jgi:hypothetical protein